MTKEPQPTTHNAERGARGTCRERSETGSSTKRTEKKVCCSLFGEISWRFGAKCSVIWRKCVAKYVGDLEKTCSAILEKTYSVIFGEDVFGDNAGDLEKRGRRSDDDFVLEFAME